jgi:hypothetical protein
MNNLAATFLEGDFTELGVGLVQPVALWPMSKYAHEMEGLARQAVRTNRRIGSLPFSESEQPIRLLIRDRSVYFRLAGSRISEQCRQFSPLGPLLHRRRHTKRATAVDPEQSPRSLEKASAISW